MCGGRGKQVEGEGFLLTIEDYIVLKFIWGRRVAKAERRTGER